MLMRCARRSLAVLLAAALALSMTACTSEPGDAPPSPVVATPAPTLVPSPSPAPTATPTPTPIETPSPTPTGTPSPTPTGTSSPTPTSTPSPTVTPTPTPTPATTPAPLITAEDLGIREVDTAEALAAAGLTHVRYAAGEEVPWDPGLFLLDVQSGAVEGWVRSLAGLPEEERGTAWNVSDDIAVSPSNRFVSWAGQGTLHDRHTGRSYVWDRGRIEFDPWWGTGSGERLLFRLASSGAFVAMSAEMQPVARFTLPPGERFTSPNGGYILVHECVGCEPGDRFHLVNLEDEASPTTHTWTLPWKTVRHRKTGEPLYRIDRLDDLVALVADAGSGSCRVVRYGLSGALLSDSTIPCLSPWPGLLPRISPDGRMLAATTSSVFADDRISSIFDAATGEEILRVKSVYSFGLAEFGINGAESGVWLADSSGTMVYTPRGPRIATIEGAWEQASGWPSRDDPGRFFSLYPPQVTNRAGDVLTSISFGDPSAPIPDPGYKAFLVREEHADWGATGGTLRVWTTFFHSQEGLNVYPPLPLAPVIEQPPFEDRLLVEVVVDTCLNLREEHALDASILACLPNGAVAETDDYYSWNWPNDWMHIRTDDGLEGWASAEYLRWHSDGVRLEETPAGTESATSPGPFTAVAVGGHYAACALTEDGEAVCWDANDPSEVETLPGRYIAIDAAEGTTCAVTEGGEAVCWGSDESASDAPPGPYTTISTTNGYTCALTEVGEAECWGSHSARAREQQDREGDVGENWPLGWMPVPPSGRYVAITVGRSSYVDGSLLSACAARASGGFVCWQSSGKYQPYEQRELLQADGDAAAGLVAGDFCAVNDFGAPHCEWSGGRYGAISMGRGHACGITTVEGVAECWSAAVEAAAAGALRVMHPPDPSPARYVSISTDGHYGCAVTDAGDAVCWESESNVVAPPDPPPGRYVSVSDGGHHTCALTEAGEVVCWGWNNRGQTDAPPGRYAAISAGEFHTCALTMAGEAVCWGRIHSDAPAGRYAAISTGWSENGGSACALTEAGRGGLLG